MLEWTGERFLPWHEDAALAVEHLHRYVYASRLAQGKCVLDIGSGEGYGSAILAAHAASVIGVDLDAAAVTHARRKYGNANLDFLMASAPELPFPRRFDLAVCFEVLEHLENQTELVAEIRRVLTPEGLLIVSTPDKRAYAAETGFDNPFHVHELYFEEFEELLRDQFPQVRMLGQELRYGSRIRLMDTNKASDSTEFQVRRHPEGFVVDDKRTDRPLYYVALGAGNQVSVPLPPNSLLTDADNAIGGRSKRIELELAERVEEADHYRWDIDWQREQLATLEATLEARNDALDWQREQLATLEATLEARNDALDWQREQLATLEATLEARNDALDWQREQLATLEATLEARNDALDWQREQLATLEATLEARNDALDWQREQLATLEATLEARNDALDWQREQLATLEATLEARNDALDWQREQLATLEATLEARNDASGLAAGTARNPGGDPGGSQRCSGLAAGTARNPGGDPGGSQRCLWTGSGSRFGPVSLTCASSRESTTPHSGIWRPRGRRFPERPNGFEPWNNNPTICLGS